MNEYEWVFDKFSNTPLEIAQIVEAAQNSTIIVLTIEYREEKQTSIWIVWVID